MRRVFALVTSAALLPLPTATQVAGPRATCRALGTDDTLRAIPPSLIGAARAAFGLDHMPAEWITRTTVWRCRGGMVLMCNYGANLPCDKANFSRTLPSEGAAWCRRNPDADFVPFYISGHSSVWHWRCHDGAPVASGSPAPTDSRGFLTQYWRKLR